MKRQAAAVAFVLAIVAAPAEAQPDRRPSASLTAGLTQFDLSGTGTRSFVAVRAQLPVLRHFIAEPGIGFMSYRLHGLPGRHRVSVWLPEVQLQAELPLGGVRPYLGAGAGLALQRVSGESVTDATLSVAGGARVGLSAGWSAGGELRIRAIDPFHGTTADWGLSVIRSF